MKSSANRETSGYSLVEVVIALTIFGFIALGITQNLVLTRGMAETGVREVTAVAVASGYIEQLKSMEYETILTSVRDPSAPLPTVLSHGVPDELLLGVWNEKDVVIDQDWATGKERTMRMRIFLEIDDLESSGQGRILALRLRYRWEDAKTRQERERILRTMRSYVPTF